MTIEANADRRWLPLYEALASDVRLRMLELLAERESNVKELAERLDLSAAIVTMHVRKLEEAGLIRTRRVRRDGGTHKLCSIAETSIRIELPVPGRSRTVRVREQSVPVGLYTSFEVHPTCGLAAREKKIGEFDDPRHFFDPERVNASILWFGRGYVEYKAPNYLRPGQRLVELELSAEIASEAPGVRDDWPSDIRFTVNGVSLGVWTSPGDYGERRRGRHTPGWWREYLNQYGLWKTIRITQDGTYLDGARLSGVTVRDLPADERFWTIRFAVDESRGRAGGLTLFGAGFGDVDADIMIRVHYEEDEA